MFGERRELVYSGAAVLAVATGLLVVFGLTVPIASGAQTKEKPLLVKAAKVTPHFAEFPGCFLIKRVGAKGAHSVGAHCSTASSPCSTFKIVNSMIGIDAGVVQPETMEKWDGSTYPFQVWQRDHNMASAFRNSVVWYYQRLARKVGRGKMQSYLEQLNYGNRSISRVDRFWLDGSLRVTPGQQLDFMDALYQQKLPFSDRAQSVVRSYLSQELAPGVHFGGKTGTQGTFEGKQGKASTVAGWYVGFLQLMEQKYIFVTRIEGPGASGPGAKKISRAILHELGLLDRTLQATAD